MAANFIPVSVLPALMLLKHDSNAMTDLALLDLDALLFAVGGLASGAIVRTDICGISAYTLVRDAMSQQDRAVISSTYRYGTTCWRWELKLSSLVVVFLARFGASKDFGTSNISQGPEAWTLQFEVVSSVRFEK